MKDSKNSFGKWFWNKYKRFTIIGVICFCLLLILIYLFFGYTTFISAGLNLKRSDWLSFLGGILALIGSIVVSVISISQASYFNEMEQERQKIQRAEDRVSEIIPELAITINARNLRIPYIDRCPSERLHLAMFGTELPDRYKEKQNHGAGERNIIEALYTYKMLTEYPIDNIWISVVNIGKYPVRHIEIYGVSYFPFLRPGDSVDVILTLDHYPRSLPSYGSTNGINYINDSNSRVKIINVEGEKIDVVGSHIEEPKQYDYIWIDCEDIDGNKYYQEFRTHPSDIGSYYCAYPIKRNFKK